LATVQLGPLPTSVFEHRPFQTEAATRAASLGHLPVTSAGGRVLPPVLSAVAPASRCEPANRLVAKGSDVFVRRTRIRPVWKPLAPLFFQFTHSIPPNIMSKGEWVDFKSIRAEVTIEQVLGHLGINNLRREGKSLVGPCPVHGGDNPRAFRVDTAKNAWYCFTACKRGGNQLDLVVAVRDVTVRDAALELKREFLDGAKAEANKPTSPSPSSAARPARRARGRLPRERRVMRGLPRTLESSAAATEPGNPTVRSGRSQHTPRRPESAALGDRLFQDVGEVVWLRTNSVRV
jgi:hypothetical protein